MHECRSLQRPSACVTQNENFSTADAGSRAGNSARGFTEYGIEARTTTEERARAREAVLFSSFSQKL
jgi:hypothetical protein